MRKAVDDLFSLIKSLNKNEKGYFKRYAQRNQKETERKNYIQLFDCIDSMQEYDEEELKRRLQDSKLLTQLPRLKHYLYESILRYLTVYHEKASLTGQFNELMDEADVLSGKLLVSQTTVIVDRAKAMAKEADKPLLLLSALDKEYSLVRRMADVSMKENFLKVGIKAMYECLEQAKNTLFYQETVMRLLTIIHARGYLLYDPGDIALIQQLEKNPMLSNEQMATSFMAKYYYNTAKATLSFFKNDFTAHRVYTYRCVKMFEERPDMMSTHAMEYVSSINNYADALSRQGDLDGLAKTVETMKSFKSERKEVQIGFLRDAITYELDIFVLGKKYAEGLRAAPRILSSIQENVAYMLPYRLVEWYYGLALIYYWGREPSQSLSLIDAVIQYGDKDSRVDYQCAARILQLMIRYDQGHHDMVESLSLSASRFMKKKKIEVQEWDLFLSAMRKVGKQNLSSKHKKILMQFLPFKNK